MPGSPGNRLIGVVGRESNASDKQTKGARRRAEANLKTYCPGRGLGTLQEFRKWASRCW